MFAATAETGRTVIAVLEPGDSVLEALAAACSRFAIEGAVIPVFLGAFTELAFIGAEEPPLDEDEPMTSVSIVRNCEGLGSGTVTAGPDGPQVHLHASVGAKGDRARATAGHVLRGTVQYPTEVVIIEILSPALSRRANDRARGIATLHIEGTAD
ncbi:PPC domain-containing DNA-binding protein [Herbiconiux sp. KACC 21604]|uniref:PPC domain-containing DNA-binding protein n=1 Tax=unclassified Herbiconiux TaxID=2618217 RepID=UPI001490F69D|nr:PPC domain-containing DNA-binding protein [Herbiconiux sp. SALV-R1]QJU53804.1 DNA-binding protein [Herbiconiux sp. SALV-R1]WPO84812.1 PPC domain-containing DNA-binding protein [Herbiconiux sp. KACC 21604]